MVGNFLLFSLLAWEYHGIWFSCEQFQTIQILEKKRLQSPFAGNIISDFCVFFLIWFNQLFNDKRGNTKWSWHWSCIGNNIHSLWTTICTFSDPKKHEIWQFIYISYYVNSAKMNSENKNKNNIALRMYYYVARTCTDVITRKHSFSITTMYIVTNNFEEKKF